MASSIAALHVTNRVDELHQVLASQLRGTLSDRQFAVLIYESSRTGTAVIVEGTECPLQKGETVECGSWGLPEGQRLKFSYRAKAGVTGRNLRSARSYGAGGFLWRP